MPQSPTCRPPCWHRPILLLIWGATLTGCCSLSDPSCAVVGELDGPAVLRELAFCPDVSCEGLNRSDWYCDPNSWNPACDLALQCGPEYGPRVPSRDAVFALPRYRAPDTTGENR